MVEYTIIFTRLAAAFAEAKYGGVMVAEERVRKALAQDDINVRKEFMAMVAMGDATWLDTDSDDWLLAGLHPRGHAVVVDTGTLTQGEKLVDGPFKGKTFYFPAPDSDWNRV
jgi:hypothetical protein